MAVSTLSLPRVRAGAHTLQGELSPGDQTHKGPARRNASHTQTSPCRPVELRHAVTRSGPQVTGRGRSLYLSWQLALSISRLIVNEEQPPPFMVTWAPWPLS